MFKAIFKFSIKISKYCKSKTGSIRGLWHKHWNREKEERELSGWSWSFWSQLRAHEPNSPLTVSLECQLEAGGSSPWGSGTRKASDPQWNTARRHLLCRPLPRVPLCSPQPVSVGVFGRGAVSWSWSWSGLRAPGSGLRARGSHTFDGVHQHGHAPLL